MRRRTLIVVAAVAGLLVLALVIMTLTLSLTAPAIGNVFSDVSSALNVTATPVQRLTPTRLPTSTRPAPLPQIEPPAGLTATAQTEHVSTPRDLGIVPTLQPGEPAGGVEAAEEEFTSTPVETAVKVADAALLIRSDVSGEIIGDGTVQIYAPRAARYPESALVRLELNLDNFYITPTPTGGRGTPVPRATSVSEGIPTAGAPLLTDSGVPVYERMGASLFCSERSFDGCDSGYDRSRARLVTSRRTTWEWTIFPRQDARGLQNLRLELWITQRNLDGQLEILSLDGTQYPFQIEVNPPAGLPPWLPVVAGAVVLALVAGVVIARRRVPAALPSVTDRKKPLVFISYRRGSSWAQARSIAQSLQGRGANVFIDVDDINEGRFAEIIETTIDRCDYFVPILTPDTLESDWVRREIRHALARKKVIIPLLADGFRLEEGTLPDDIREIASHNAITLLPEFYEEAINRLAERFLKL
ncbi:MAG: toll/interleukin-1 receptor domain-containing protein [Chloroflexi bacterium]|nr:toll/interleukin-1 receptor domain-containing protein [Chloroflexota bacterium]